MARRRAAYGHALSAAQASLGRHEPARKRRRCSRFAEVELGALLRALRLRRHCRGGWRRSGPRKRKLSPKVAA